MGGNWGILAGVMQRGVPDSRVATDAECRRAIAFSLLLVASMAAPYGFVTTGAADGQPDLEVIDVWTDPADPNAGENVEFCMEVENTGTVTADSVEVRAYVDGELAAVPPTTTLGPGERATTVCTGNNEFNGGTYTVRAAIDPDDHIAESDETNNDVERSFSVDTSYGSISGRVTDTDGNPISSAKVYLDSRNDIRTDSDGYFTYDQVPVGDHDIDVVMSGYDADGQKYVTVREGETSRINFALDPETHTVRLDSSPISVSTNGDGTYDYGEDVDVWAPATAGDYEFEAWTTDDGTVVSDEPSFTISHINREVDITAQYAQPGQPDLTITDINTDPSSPDAGDSVTFDVEVANYGEARASNVNLELVAGSSIYRAEGMDLEPGESGTVVLGDWTAQSDVDEVRAEIDYDDRINEEDETNNAYRESLDIVKQLPNLRVVDVDPSPQSPDEGESVSFDVTVENTGPVATGDFGVLVNVDGQQYSKTQIDLDSGSRQTVTVGPWDADSTVDSGEAVVDFRDTVKEDDESDNTERFSLSVDRQEPDLMVENVEWQPADPNAGENVEFCMDVANTGTVTADNVEVRAYVNGEIAAVPPTITLGPGERAATVCTGTNEFDSGTYTVHAVIDPDDHISESDETNNQIERSFSVDSYYGSISGRVTDTDGNPISSAKVYLDSRNDIRTDSDGYFSYDQVPAGDHEIDVAMSGYDVDGPKYVTVQEGETSRVDFELEPESHTVRLDSSPVSVSTSGEGTYNYGEDVDVSAPATAGDYEFQAWTTDDGTVVSDEPSFTISHINRKVDITAQYAQPGQPDLTITDINADPDAPDAGDSVTFDVEVANRGEARASNVKLELVAGSSIYRTDGIDIEPGESGTVPLGDWTAQSGVDEVRAEIDYDGRIDEEDETNNEHRESLDIVEQQPNIQVVDVEPSPQSPDEGESVYFDVTVDNTGPVATDDFGVIVNLDGQQYSKTRIDLGAGGRQTVTVGPWDADPTVDGGEAVVDFRDTIEEDDESDNTERFAMSVDRQEPDLTITGIDTDPNSPDAGDPVTFDVEVANHGQARASNVNLELVAGSSIYRAEGIALEPGESGTVPLGDWTTRSDADEVRAEIDYDDSIDEEDETNNRLSEQLRVQSETDLRVDAIRTDPATPRPDNDVTPFARVVNDGGRRVEDVVVTLTVDERRLDTAAVTLEPDSAELVQFDSWNPTSGSHDVAVEVNPTNQVPDRDESNDRNDTVIEVAPDVGTASIIVEDGDGNPIPDATVELADGRVTATTDDGSATFEDIPTGTYEASIEASGFDRQTTTVRVEADAPTRETVVLSAPPAGEIEAVRNVPEEFETGLNQEIEVRVTNTGPVERRYTLDLTTSTAVTADRGQQSLVIPEGETETVTIDLSFGQSDSEQSLALELHAEDGTELGRYQRSIDPVTSEKPLKIAVTDESGAAVSGADVEIVGPIRESTQTDADGLAMFNDPEPGDYLVQVTADEIRGGSETTEATVRADELEEVSITVETTADEATVDGTVTWDDGSIVEDGTAVLKVDDGDGARTTAVTDGSFSFPESVQPNKYRLVIRQDDEVIAERSVWLGDGSNSMSLTAQTANQNAGRVKSGITGAVMGDWCWRDEGSPPSYCGDEVTKYPMAFFAGWLASGFAIVGDIRDLPSTALKGKPVDFAITLVGLVPAYGDAASILSKVGKFLGKFPSKTDDVVDLIVDSRIFKGHRVDALDKTYDGAGTSLTRNTDLTEDEVVRMADNGHDLRDVRKLSKMGLSAEALRGLDRVSWADPKRTRRWLEDAREIKGSNADEFIGKIDSELANKLNKPNSSPGHLYEAKVASETKREVGVVEKTIGDGRNVEDVSRNVKTAKGNTDIDLLMSDGTAVEVKRSLPTDEDLVTKFEKYKQFQNQQGYQQAKRYLVVGTEKSELRSRNPELVDKLQEMGVRIVTDRDEAIRSIELRSGPSQGTSKTISTKYSSVRSG